MLHYAMPSRGWFSKAMLWVLSLHVLLLACIHVCAISPLQLSVIHVPVACRSLYFEGYPDFAAEMVPGAKVVLLDDPKADEWSVGRLVRVDWERKQAQVTFKGLHQAEFNLTGQVTRMRPVDKCCVEDSLRNHSCASEAPSFVYSVSPYEVHLCDLDPASEEDRDPGLLVARGLGFYHTGYYVNDTTMHSSCKQPIPPARVEGRPDCLDAPFINKSCLQPGQYRDEDLFYSRYNYRCGVGNGESGSMWADANYYHSLCQKDDAVSAVEGSSDSDSCFKTMSGGFVEHCRKGPPPPNSTLLWIGNSRLRQLYEAQMIYNMEHIGSVEYVKESDIRLDSPHTFADLSSSCQADFWSKRQYCITDLSRIVWKNGAVWYSSVNNDLNLNLMRGLRGGRGVQAILDVFSLGSGASLDAIIINSGNKGKGYAADIEGAANLDLYGETGRMLHSSTLGRLHCIPCIMADLHSLHWTGKLYVVHDSMRISSQQIAFFSKWIRRLSNFAPFRIQYFSYDPVQKTTQANYWRLRGYSYNSFIARDLLLKANKPEISPTQKDELRAHANKIVFSCETHPCLFTLPLERSRVLMSDLWTL